MNKRRPSPPERGSQRAAPPDDAGSRGDFSFPEESLREPEPGETPAQARRPGRSRRDRTNEKLGSLAAVSLVLVLILGLLAFFLYAAGF